MKVLARIRLFAAEDGGRNQPLIGSFRPNHCFGPGTFAIGEVEQEVGAALYPGKSGDVIVRFIPEGVPKLIPGLQWKIFDGPSNLIGSATVLKVLEV